MHGSEVNAIISHDSVSEYGHFKLFLSGEIHCQEWVVSIRHSPFDKYPYSMYILFVPF